MVYRLLVTHGTFYDEALECTVNKVDWYTKYIRVRRGTKRWYSSGASLLRSVHARNIVQPAQMQ